MINHKEKSRVSTIENEIVDEELEEEEDGRLSDNINLNEDETSWMTDIDSSNIKNDPEFTFSIGIFVEAAPEYYGIMEMFNEAAVHGRRWKIKVISKEYIKNVVYNNLRSNKYRPFKQLCTQIISYAGYDLEEKVPTKLLAYFIMYEIRRLKNDYNQMKIYNEEIEQGKLNHLEEAFNYDCPKQKNDNFQELLKAKASLSSQEGMLIREEYGSRRPESELSTRLEDRDLRFIEDYPLQGPQVYIAITTIYDAQLPTELIEVLGVPVHCVVKVGNDSKKEGEEDNEQENNPNQNQNILQDITNYYYKRNRNKRRAFHQGALNEQKRIDICNFWTGMISKIQHPEKTSFYALTTLAIYKPSLDNINFDDKNWKDNLKRLLYDEISHVLYNQYDLNVLYGKYMSSMEVTQLDPLGNCKLENMKVYNGILQNIPNESINIPIIFDSIIAQVSALFGEENGYEDVLAHVQRKKSHKKKNLVTNLKELNLIHDILTVKDDLNNYKPRTILNGDTARLKSFHLGEAAKFITQKTFRVLSIGYKNLFKNIKIDSVMKDGKKKHMHVFRNVIGIRDRKKISELLILLAIIDRNPFGPIFHPKTQTTENQDESTDTSGQYLIEDALNNINKIKIDQNHKLIQNLNAIEEMHPEVLVQTLHNMSITHNTTERKYIPLLDGYLFKFYNCPKNHYKTCVMQTPITLRDFVKFSLPEEIEWANLSLQEFQQINLPKTFPSDLHLLKKEIIDPIDPPINVTPYLIVNSDSFGSAWRPRRKDEEQSVSSSEWEDEEKYVQVPKIKQKNIPETKDKHKQTVSKIYNVGPGKRLQFYARDIEAMFRHGTKLRIQFEHQLYEKKIINLELQTSAHRIYYSTSLSVNEDPISLLIYHRSGIILSFQQKECKKCTARFTKLIKPEEYSEPEVSTADYTEKDEQNEKLKNHETKEKYNNTTHENDFITIDKAEELERCQIKPSPHPFINRLCTFSFSASWPNGYYMECNTLPNTEKIYIKHSYFTKGPSCKLIENETYRLNLPNDNVIKFLKNKTFEILFPTGNKIICKKYFWRKTKKQKREVRTQSIYEKIIREIIPIQYTIFHTDGRTESFKDGKKESEGKINIRNSTDVLNDLKVSEMANGTTIVQKNDASQIVEFNDGTRFTTVVQLNEEEIFCDWSLEDKLKWFQGFSEFLIMSDISDIGHPHDTIIKNTTLRKGILENEGYINITKTVFIEHPNFASTYNCSETKSTIIRFPMSTTIYLYSNGTYDIRFGNGTNIAIKKDRFVIDKYLQNSLFQHTVIMPQALKFNDNPDPPLIQFLTSDIYGNELKIDTTNFIHYRYALSEKNKFCLKHFTDNVNYFFLRRDMSGMEIFPQCRLLKIREINKKIKDSYVQEFWNTPFKDTILLSPTLIASEQWLMPYSGPILSVFQNAPSTYGKSWVFPFDPKESCYVEVPKTLTMRVVKTFICENVYKKIIELIDDYKNVMNNQKWRTKCKCHKVRPWEHISFDNMQDIASILYKHGNIIIKTPDVSFINYVKEYIVLHAARVAIKERKNTKIIERYQSQRSALLKKQIPPYFSSCFGIAYLLTKEIKEKTNKAIEEMEYSSVLDALLNKKMNLVTENDINDITRLIKMLKPGQADDLVSLQNILNTGKELQENFSNMREVLKYHIGANLSNESLENIF